MTDPAHWLPLTGESVQSAYTLIKEYVYQTPVLTCKTLNRIASTPQTPESLVGTPYEGQTPAKPKINFFFKCENYQRIGAFKVRGAFHSVLRLIQTKGEEEVRKRGVITHSSGNHAQALALAAHTLNIPAYIIMPSISTPSKIEGTKSYGAKVIFSGSTSQEREAVVADVQKETGAILVPPYDHPDTILGQGTVGLELEAQVAELLKSNPALSAHGEKTTGVLDAVVTPTGGAGLTSGVATFFAGKSTAVFGSEPSFQGADDCRRGLESGTRVTSVKSLTIADGLRTPVGEIPWTIVSDPKKVRGVYAVSEEQIKGAMRLVLERMKVVIEPSAAVPLAVCLYNEEFRRLVEREAGDEGWDVGVVFSGGNTTVDAIAELFGKKQ
ncbi:hypothetical protein VTO42DRAFT_142 [Malbranchea cinnamomea]